nr:MAG TPA: hypothetical protein [Caudoviricetes sp.]
MPEKAAALVERGNLIDVEQTLRRCTFERPEESYDNDPRLHRRSPPTCGSGSATSVTSTSTATEYGAIGRSAHSRPPVPYLIQVHMIN